MLVHTQHISLIIITLSVCRAVFVQDDFSFLGGLNEGRCLHRK